MTQTNWYQSIMNGFSLQDCITVTKIGVIANDLAVLSHSNSIVNVYIKDVCQIEDKTEYRVIYYFNTNLPKLIVSDSMDSLMNKITSLRTKNKVEESTPMNNENSRIPFPFYYLGIAEAVSKRSTCLSKRYGAVIVKDNSIKSTGYNGAPKGRKNCTEIGQCPRITNNIQRGTNYSTSCRSCLSKDTVIKLLNGKYKTIEELYNSKEDSFWVYAVDTKTGQIVPAKAKNVHPVKRVDSLIKITLDNGESFECTDDHLIMLRDGTYVEASKLSVGDSLMAMYYSFENADHEYIRNYNKKDHSGIGSTKRIPTHKLVYEFFNPPVPKGNVIHHVDFDSHNNEPDNLTNIGAGEHVSIHNNTPYRRAIAFGGEEGRKRSIEASRKAIREDEYLRVRLASRSRETMRDNWSNPIWREKQKIVQANNTKYIRNLYNQDPDIILKRRRSMVAKTISNLMWLMFCNHDNRKLTEENFNKIRKQYQQHNGRGNDLIPKLKTIYKYYDSFDEAIKAGRWYNHKVADIEIVEYDDYVYDMTVPKYHNFAIDLGDNSCVFVHNCHSEWNAIINASPEEMKDATLYLYGYDRVAKRIVKDANCCPICKRMIINAGIKDVVIADLDNGIGHPEVPYRYRTIKVADWIENDESLQANEGY